MPGLHTRPSVLSERIGLGLVADGAFSCAEFLRIYCGFAGGVVDASEKGAAVAASGAAHSFVSHSGRCGIAGSIGFVGSGVVFPRSVCLPSSSSLFVHPR